jgi:competence protein ComEC
MAAWAALAMHIGRPLPSLLTLLLASATLLLSAPGMRFDLGFQLSCASTLGIIVWARPLQALVRRLRRLRRVGRLAAFCVGSAGISLAAQLATLPLVAWKFGYLSRASLLSNLAIVPLANGALVLGLAGVPWALVAPGVARTFWLLSGGLLHGAIRVGNGITSLGEPRWFLPTSAAVLGLAACAAVLALGAGCLGTSRRWRAGAACVVLLAGCLGGIVVVIHSRPAPRWRLEALDVGQGDALLLRVGEQAWLVDAGDAHPRNQGERVVLPHLRRAGIARLRGVVLTHPHDDHIGGALAVLQGIAVDTLYLARVSHQARNYAPLLAHDVPQRWLQEGDRIVLGAGYEATVLWPGAEDSLGSGPNGQSLVLWGRGGGNPQVLTMGDLEADGEAALLALYATRLVTAGAEFLVLKAGHHGSRTSSSPEFLDTIQPDVALVSVGASNRYGHPAQETLRGFAARHCLVLRTDQGGAIRLDRRGESLYLQRPGGAVRLLTSIPSRLQRSPRHSGRD